MTGTPTLGEAVRKAIESRLLDLHVALPAVVAKYDKADQTVEVTPLLKRMVENSDGGFSTEELPKLPPMPVLQPHAGDMFLALPISKGDTGLVVFCEASMDQWLGTAAVADDVQQSPGDGNRHTLGSGVFIPGLFNRKRRLSEADDMELRMGEDGGVQLRQAPSGHMEVIKEGESSETLAYLSDVQKLIDGIAAAATVPADGGAAFKSNIGLNMALPLFSIVGTSNLKAK